MTRAPEISAGFDDSDVLPIVGGEYRRFAVSCASSAALQAAIDGATAGDVLYVSNSGGTWASPVVLNKAVSLVFTGGSFAVTHNGTAIRVQTNGARLHAERSTYITGPRTTNAFVSGSIGVYVEGTNAVPRSDFRLTGDFIIQQFKAGPVRLDFLSDFKVYGIRGLNNTYYGIMCISVSDGKIVENSILDMHPEGLTELGASGVENAYGIALSRNGAVSLATSNVSHNVDVIRNTIRGVKTWTGLDTHGGYNIAFLDNKISQCCRGLYLTLSDLDSGYVAPSRLRVSRNEITGNAYGGGATNGWGIFATGTTDYTASDVLIQDNIVSSFGWNGDGAAEKAAAIAVDAVVGFSISGNALSNIKHRGILAAGSVSGKQCYGNISDNVITGVTTSGEDGVGIEVSGAYVAANITGGMFTSMTYALHSPVAGASGNFGTSVARALTLSQVTGLWKSSVGKVDLGASAL